MKLIGYVAHNMTLDTSASKTARLRNVTDEVLAKLIKQNLESLKQIIKWNVRQDILFYRITSNLIPYASHPVNKIDWAHLFRADFEIIGNLINKSKILVSMHPGQYTVLSSPNSDFVNKSIKEIEYHCTVLDLLNQDEKAKIILHVGGAYSNKGEAIKRWIENFKLLSPMAQRRLVIENDDVVYKVSDCLVIHRQIAIPVVFDNLHYRISPDEMPAAQALKKCLQTWQSQKVLPEVHYSQQAAGKAAGAHAYTIDLDKFKKFYEETKELDFNIMLETKDKELSVLKILHLLETTS